MKSPVRVVLGAAGNSPWVPLSYLQSPFGVTMAVTLSSTGNLTYTVQYTYDEMSDQDDSPVIISRTTTTATVTWPDHGMVTGDAVITYATGDANLDSAVDAQKRPIAQDITVTDDNTFTYVVANTGATAGATTSKAKRFRVFPHAVLVALTAKADSNFNLPCQAVRLKVTSYTAGKATLTVTQGSGSGT